MVVFRDIAGGWSNAFLSISFNLSMAHGEAGPPRCRVGRPLNQSSKGAPCSFFRLFCSSRTCAPKPVRAPGNSVLGQRATSNHKHGRGLAAGRRLTGSFIAWIAYQHPDRDDCIHADTRSGFSPATATWESSPCGPLFRDTKKYEIRRAYASSFSISAIERSEIFFCNSVLDRLIST